MKKTYYALIILPTILFIIPIIFYFLSGNDPEKATQENTSSYTRSGTEENPEYTQQANTENSQKNYVSNSSIEGYMIKSSDDNIHIYELYDNGHAEKIKSLDINPKFLRKIDQEELKAGITKQSYKEICSLIEDYSS